ncbi:MAG: FtsX-like permease family protein [Bacteroidetes bacterium]|nr:FtsX-like permease family protein [Bacteroidota bacterium]
MSKRPVKELDDLNAFSSFPSFIMLSKNASPNIVEDKMKQLCNRYKITNFKFQLQPVQDIHLNSASINNGSTGFNIYDIKYVYINGCIALLILIIGCINFINLTIARSLERTKEVGVRKVMGAQKNQLVFQFIGETALYFIIAIPIALMLAILCWNGFIHLLNINAGISFLLNINAILNLIGVCFLSIIISSLYPAFFLSRLQPAETLKGGFISGMHLNMGLRKILVVVQFTISIALIAATIIIHAQLKYLNNGPLGFNKSNLVNLYTPWSTNQGKAFKNELLANPNIQFFTYSTVHFAGQYSSTGSNDDPNDSTKQMYFAFIDGDFDFLKTFQIPLSSGRDFSPAYPSDLLDYDSLFQKQIQKNKSGKTTNDVTDNPFLILAKQPIIITDDMVKALGLKNPIGHTINMGACRGTIIGTIKEFNGISLKEKTPFIVIRCSQNRNAGQAYARIKATNTQATISYISGKYKQFFPNEQFGFFVEDDIAHLYDLELRLTKLFNIFTLFVIALSGMGLFSLVALMVHKRAKEIGIRKVLDASVNDVMVLISKDFLRLIIISFVIATPITYLVMYKWLQGYANRTEMSWWIFLVAGATAILVAVVCIIYKTIVAAKANPSEEPV